MDIAVRTAHPTDADAIADAHIAAWRAGYQHIFPQSIFDDPEFDRSRRSRWNEWDRHSRSPELQLLVGLADDRVVGFALAGHALGDPDVGELHGCYVHPDAWNTGVSRVMWDATAQHLRSLGHDRAVVWTLRDATRARAFYEKSGWTLSGQESTWTGYPKHPVPEVQYEIEL